MSETVNESAQERINEVAANFRRDFNTLYPALPTALPDILSKQLNSSFVAANINRGLPGKAIEDEFGKYLDRTGVAYQDEVVNDCITAYTAQGNPVMVGAGIYALGRSLMLIDGAKVLSSPKARYRKKFGTFALLTQADFGVPISNVQWRGGILEHDDPTNQSSNPLTLNLIESEVSHVMVTKWGDIGRLLLFGNRNRLHNIVALNEDDDGVGQGGGLWVGRALNNLCEFLVIKTGDDGLMWNLSAQGAYTGGENAGNVYANCVVISTNSRMLVAAMQRIQDPPLPDMDGTIHDNTAVNIVGEGMGGFGAYNTLSTGPMHGLSVSKSVFKLSNYDASFAGIDINADAAHGGLYDFDLDRVIVDGPYERALHVRGVATDIRVRRSTLGAPRTTQNTVEIDEEACVYLDGNTVYSRSDADAIQVGADDLSTARAYLTKNRILDIADSHDGVVFTSSYEGSLEGNYFKQTNGATSARAAAVLANTRGLRIGPNDYSSLAINAKILWLAPDDYNNIINTPNVITTATNTTTYAYLSGMTYVFTAAGSRTLTLPDARAAMEFTLVQEGSGAAVLRAAGSNTIRQPGSVSSAGGTLTSGAQGNFVHVRSILGKWIVVAIGGTWTAA